MKKTPDVSLKEQIKSLQDDNKHLRAKLSLSNASFLNIVGNSTDAVVIINKEKMLVYANFAAINLFNCSMADLLGKPFPLSFNPAKIVNAETTVVNIPKADGSESITEVSVFRTEWNNEACYILIFRDITERKKNEKMLEYLSKHDYLTELPNRVFFEEQITEAIQQAKQNDCYVALLYFDLDNFKTINDSLGHSYGDLLLKAVSRRLKENVRKADTVSRWGGDEFAIILRYIRKPNLAEKIAHVILDKIEAPFFLEGEEIFINASIGIAVYPLGGITAETLIRNADKAMYYAKAHGKNQYRVYSKSFNTQSELSLQVINGLRNFIRKQELFLLYQPIINLNTMQCVGIEALVRWNHPNLGVILPDQFLPEAEAAGIIKNLGQWVINQALSDYLQLKNIEFISINISANEFIASTTIDVLLSLLKKNKIETSKVVLELTETTVMRQALHTIKKFNYLAKKGIKIAIDDYGAGYSSLNALKQLKVSILKIDRSFIKNVTKDPKDIILVKSTIELAHSLGLKVVAEGIETAEQLEILKMNQCDYIQGNYFSKPMGFDELIHFLDIKSTFLKTPKKKT